MLEWFRKKEDTHQKWEPHWSVSLLYKIWMVIFTAAKIALGAVATVLLIGVVCGVVFAGVLGDYLEEDILPSAGLVLENYDMDETSYLYYVDSDGQIKQLQQIYADTVSKRADYEEIPQYLVHAAVAIEDKRFYEHQGVDWFTTIKAVANMFFGDQTVGGSSITQQLIKNVTEEDSVTVQRKVREFFQAVHVEKRYDKNTIMEAYMNYIYMGQGCRGVKSAAATYFGKELQMLNLAECASLISITNNPSLFDPYSDDEFEFAGEVRDGMGRNKYRQKLVLNEMLKQGWISQEEYDEAIAYELVLKNGISDEDTLAKCTNGDFVGTVKELLFENNIYYCPVCHHEINVALDSSQEVYSWFVEAALEEVARDMVEKDGLNWNDTVAALYMDTISRSGYHIYTTLDKKVQDQVDKIYGDLNEIPDTYSAQQLLSGIVIVDNKSGDIVALAGGVGEKTVFDAYSVATEAKLQSGSSFKPLAVYGPAFEMGAITPATVVKDLPYMYEDGNSKSPWPRNDNKRYSYTRTIFKAIEDSVNASAVDTLVQIGTSYSYNFAKNKFGISTLVERYETSSGEVKSDIQLSPLALGAQTVGVTVRDMAVAYATFANKGVYRDSRLYTVIYNSQGDVVYRNPQESRRILSEKTVDYMNYCLTNAVTNGTGIGAWMSNMTVAGKTGSTSSFRDRWFCGYTGYYTAAVWCGYQMPEEINPVNGGNVATYLWRKVLAPLHEGKANVALYNESKMIKQEICRDSGLLATDACRADTRKDIRNEGRIDKVMVYKEDAIDQYCDKHTLVDYCTSGHGIANEYCKHFAEAGETDGLETKVYVKYTAAELAELEKAKNAGLESIYLDENYIYPTDGECKVHTKEAWEAYLASQQPIVPPEDPDDPVIE